MDGDEEKGVVQRSRPGVWVAALPGANLNGDRVYRSIGTAHTKSQAKKVLRQYVRETAEQSPTRSVVSREASSHGKTRG